MILVVILNVNILGQIFEQSIADVEQIKKEINGIPPVGRELKKTIFRDGAFEAEVIKSSTGRKNVITISSWVEIPEEKEGLSESEIMYRKAVFMLHQKYWNLYEDMIICMRKWILYLK